MRNQFKMKKLVAGVLTLMMVVCGLVVENSAKAGVATRKCYTISAGNTPVYSNTALTQRYGTIFGSDEVTVITVTGRYCKVCYQIKNGMKTGYISTSAILTGTTGNSYRSRAKITTYKRPGGATYGYVAVNDIVTVLGVYGNFTQIKYPVVSGYKYAFITTANANAYIYPQKVQQPVVTPKPVTSNNTALCAPVPSGCKFSMKTYDGGWYGYHDINRGVSTGTPVYAITDGTVTYKQAYRVYNGVKKLTSYGNFIEFRSSNGVYTAKYCHLNRFVGANQYISSSMTVRASGSTGVYNCGSRTVRKGEIIGYVGQTGNATGVHLHFELRKNGTRIDPTSVISGLY